MKVMAADGVTCGVFKDIVTVSASGNFGFADAGRTDRVLGRRTDSADGPLADIELELDLTCQINGRPQRRPHRQETSRGSRQEQRR